MRFRRLKCPLCGTQIPNAQYRANGPTVCPGCGHRVRIAAWYQNAVMSIAFLITVGTSYFLGFRGLGLLAATVIGFFPVFLLTIFGIGEIFPPPFRLWKEKGPDAEPAPFDNSTDLFRH